jgi:formylglycine-generating enzyme required for sulfatase activity
VSWGDCQEFLRRLTEREQKAGTLPEGAAYRLPTEAEWEYACRAGATTVWSFGDGEEGLAEHGWYADNSRRGPHPVGRKRPNGWGLYDMYGNVGEWCQDRYGAYPTGDEADPTGPTSGDYRVLRGGGWHSDALFTGSACRSRANPEIRGSGNGFRVARSLP